MAAKNVFVEVDGLKIAIQPGTTALQLLEQRDSLDPAESDPIVIVSINGRRTSLAEPLFGDERIRFIRMKSAEVQTTIQRTVQFLALAAAEDIFPGVTLNAHFSCGTGMYCELDRPEPLTENEIEALAARMRQLIDQDLPLTPQRFGLRALQKIYQRQGDVRSLTTAKYLRRDSLVFYSMEGSELLYFGRQLPSTGYVRAFSLVPESPGFVLLTNVKGDPDQVPEYIPQPELLHTLREYTEWAEKIGMHNTGSINEFIVEGRTGELIQISEARHDKFFVEAAQRVADLPEEGRLVLLAGPSSSGKTSSAKRLMIQLRVLGLQPMDLSLDNYFVDREKTPRDEDGDYDFESLGTLNVELFNQHLKALLAGEEVHLPRFDFRTGTSTISDKPTRIQRGQPLLVEGIHALNPALTPAIPPADKLKIYVSALCHLNINNISYIKTTHSRLFRRMVRDAQFRGYTASETLARWPKVREGEDKHIFPHQSNADLFFNSGLTYELAVLKLWAEPRLAAVTADDPHYGLARTLIDLLSLLLPIDASQVPPTSLLREFIGGSGFNY
jgi:uridine kinase